MARCAVNKLNVNQSLGQACDRGIARGRAIGDRSPAFSRKTTQRQPLRGIAGIPARLGNAGQHSTPSRNRTFASTATGSKNRMANLE
jgi:hypothetical protein